jgi:MFS family permease
LLNAHQVAFLLDASWAPLLVTSLVALLGILTIPFRAILGACSDRFGREPTYTFGVLSLVGALGLLIILGSGTSWTIGPYLYIFLFSIASSTAAPLNPAIVADFFGGPSYGLIYGFLMIGSGLGSASGVYGGGFIFDYTGNYNIAFVLVVVLALTAITAIWSAAPRKGLCISSRSLI